MRGFDGFEAAVAVLPWDIRRRALALSPGERVRVRASGRTSEK